MPRTFPAAAVAAAAVLALAPVAQARAADPAAEAHWTGVYDVSTDPDSAYRTDVVVSGGLAEFHAQTFYLGGGAVHDIIAAHALSPGEYTAEKKGNARLVVHGWAIRDNGTGQNGAADVDLTWTPTGKLKGGAFSATVSGHLTTDLWALANVPWTRDLVSAVVDTRP